MYKLAKKALLCVILTVAILSQTIAVWADTAKNRNVTITGGEAQAKQHIKADVIVDNPDGIAGVQCKISYDNTKLKIEESGITLGSAFVDFTYDKNLIADKSYLKLSAANKTGLSTGSSTVIFSIDILVLDNTSQGETTLNIDELLLATDKSVEIPVDIKNGVIKIVPASSEDPVDPNPVDPNPVNPNPVNTDSGKGQTASQEQTKDQKNYIFVNGQKQSGVVTEEIKHGEDGEEITVLSVDADKMKKILESQGANPVITILSNGGKDNITGEFSGDIIKSLIDKKALIQVIAGNAQFSLPSERLNLQEAINKIGVNAKPEDIIVQVKIFSTNATITNLLESSAKTGGFDVLAHPIGFEVEYVCKDKTVEVESFSTLVKRLIQIPSGVDPKKVTTAIEFEENGTYRHIPSKVVTIDGKYYVQINSTTNGTFALVSHSNSFTDIKDHWAKDIINEMSSRFIINGTGDNKFDSESSITRAEFATIMVKALGLKTTDSSKRVFSDVSEEKWYFEFINTAVMYGIVSGNGTGGFEPMEKISREQAMTSICNAFALCNQNVNLAEQDKTKSLEVYKDAANISDWAKTSIETCLKTGIVSGRGNEFIAPKDDITRAETAAIIKKFLQKMGLI